jgi:hypothetical protein
MANHLPYPGYCNESMTFESRPRYRGQNPSLSSAQ